jgi:class 3 adenylate cyclase
LTSDEPADSVSEGEAAPSGKAVRRQRVAFRMSVQSKLLLMLLTCSIMSVAVVGIIGYQTGRDGLRSMASQRLIELRGAQQRAIETLFREMTNSLVIYSHGSAAVDALRSFIGGFDQLGNATISAAQQQAILRYYTDKIVAPIAHTTGVQLDVNALLPTSNAQKYLQAAYTASSSGGDPIKVDDAGDGSAWSAANARFNSYFREIATRAETGDAMLLDTRGNIVYTAAKGPDLGSNILTGPYRESNLRGAYQKAMGANAVDFVGITDFYPYQPQLDSPTAWLVSPIGENGKIEGALALPLPVAKVNRIMTADKQWAAAGMGKGTETYLAGPDNLMRSDSRLFLEDPKAYRRDVVAAGTPPDVADKAIRLGGTTLVQPVRSAGLRNAQRGQTGVISDTDYLGNTVLEAYAPLNLPDSDLHWSILATRDREEAFAAISSFGRTMVLGVVVMIFFICVASMLLAQVILRPVRRLETGTQKISSGDYEVNIPVTSRDEIGRLTAAFNEMSRNLAIKEQLLNEQRLENERMLLSLMPESVVQRYREGEQTIAQEHHDVTVIFADIAGLDEVSDDVSGDELVEMVDDLFRQFDSAAESLGVERIRTLHNWYLASCGVTTPRLDDIRRTMEFAIEMRHIIDRFNSQSGHNLRLRAGINSGNVISGLVGQSGLVYDMWGRAVSLVYQMYPGSAQPGIYVTAPVYEAMREMWKFTPVATVTVSGVEQQIWRLSERK